MFECEFDSGSVIPAMPYLNKKSISKEETLQALQAIKNRIEILHRKITKFSECVECGGFFNLNKLKEVYIWSAGTRLYCKHCKPSYDKLCKDHDGNLVYYKNNVPCTENGEIKV